MNDKKIKYCIFCKKKLVDEKIFCRRCVLEGRNKTEKIATLIGSVGLSILTARSLMNIDSNDSSEEV